LLHFASAIKGCNKCPKTTKIINKNLALSKKGSLLFVGTYFTYLYKILSFISVYRIIVAILLQLFKIT
jgi:hypothetical protein